MHLIKLSDDGVGGKTAKSGARTSLSLRLAAEVPPSGQVKRGVPWAHKYQSKPQLLSLLLGIHPCSVFHSATPPSGFGLDSGPVLGFFGLLPGK